MKSLQMRLFVSLYSIGHTALKRFNGIDTITTMIVFLAVIAINAFSGFIVCDRSLNTLSALKPQGGRRDFLILSLLNVSVHNTNISSVLIIYCNIAFRQFFTFFFFFFV